MYIFLAGLIAFFMGLALGGIWGLWSLIIVIPVSIALGLTAAYLQD